MIAVIDRDPERRVVIGAAAPACLVGRLVDRGAYALCGQPHRGGKAGETGTDDVD